MAALRLRLRLRLAARPPGRPTCASPPGPHTAARPPPPGPQDHEPATRPSRPDHLRDPVAAAAPIGARRDTNGSLRRQATANIVDAVEVHMQEPTESVLNDVLGAAEVAKHLEGEIDQKRSVPAPHQVDGRVVSAVHRGLFTLIIHPKDEIGAPNVTWSELPTNWHLLHRPSVAVRIAEKDE